MQSPSLFPPAPPQQPQPPTYPGTPTAYPTYSPLPPGSVHGTQAPAAYGTGYPAQIQPAINQCKVCGSTLPYGMLVCSFCNVPVGMIANPHDPTVTTYLDARALNQPGTSPVYAAPGAYPGRQAGLMNDMPNEARQGWNWAAALNSTLWAFTHRSAGWGLLCAASLAAWVLVILGMSSMSAADLHSGPDASSRAADAVITVIFAGGFGLMWIVKTVYLGSKGNAIAWRSGRYTSISQMKNVQRQWTPWSIAVFLVASAVLLTATYISGNR